MTIHERERLVAKLKGAPMNSGEFATAMIAADHRTLVDAAKECILRPVGVLVNRRKVEFLLDTLLDRITLLPPIEPAEQKKAKGRK